MMAAWKITAVSGVLLVTVCLVTSFANLRFDFIGDQYGYLLAFLMLGTLISMVGLIGWATKLERRNRFIIAALVFIYPWAALFVGYLVVPRDDIPGLAHMGLGLLILPSWVLAFVLLVTAAVAKPRS